MHFHHYFFKQRLISLLRLNNLWTCSFWKDLWRGRSESSALSLFDKLRKSQENKKINTLIFAKDCSAFCPWIFSYELLQIKKPFVNRKLKFFEEALFYLKAGICALLFLDCYNWLWQSCFISLFQFTERPDFWLNFGVDSAEHHLQGRHTDFCSSLLPPTTSRSVHCCVKKLSQVVSRDKRGSSRLSHILMMRPVARFSSRISS